jgi:hypothetical protein
MRSKTPKVIIDNPPRITEIDIITSGMHCTRSIYTIPIIKESNIEYPIVLNP